MEWDGWYLEGFGFFCFGGALVGSPADNFREVFSVVLRHFLLDTLEIGFLNFVVVCCLVFIEYCVLPFHNTSRLSFLPHLIPLSFLVKIGGYDVGSYHPQAFLEQVGYFSRINPQNWKKEKEKDQQDHLQENEMNSGSEVMV